MNHTLEECELSSNPLDYCDPCGELSACTCLGSIVDTWSISKLTFPLSFAPEATHAFTYVRKGEAGEYWGTASSYREAMDAIAHSVVCAKEGK